MKVKIFIFEKNINVNNAYSRGKKQVGIMSKKNRGVEHKNGDALTMKTKTNTEN